MAYARQNLGKGSTPPASGRPDQPLTVPKSACPYCAGSHHDNTKFICDNDCRTVYCSCGNEFYLDIGEARRGHDPACGYI